MVNLMSEQHKEKIGLLLRTMLEHVNSTFPGCIYDQLKQCTRIATPFPDLVIWVTFRRGSSQTIVFSSMGENSPFLPTQLSL